MTDTATACRHCGVLVLRVVEGDARAAALQAAIDATPYTGDPSRAPPHLTIWARLPRYGWACLDTPESVALPIHLEHECTPRPPRPATPPRPAEQARPERPTMSIWDDPAIQPEDSDFVKFNEVGDEVIGRITNITTKTFNNDKGGVDTVPQLALTMPDGAEKTLTAGAFDLRKKLIEARPDVGDDVRVMMIGRDGKQKKFKVDVKRGGDATPAAMAPAAATADPPF